MVPLIGRKTIFPARAHSKWGLGRNSAKYLWITCVLICHAFTVLITLTYVDECKKHIGNHQSPTLRVIIADHQMLLGDKLVIIKCYVGFVIGDRMQKNTLDTDWTCVGIHLAWLRPKMSWVHMGPNMSKLWFGPRLNLTRLTVLRGCRLQIGEHLSSS